MKRTEIFTLPENIPADLRRFCEGARIYDSSCSPEARVIFIDRDGGYFLKSSAGGSLKKEAELAGYFHTKGLTAPVLSYATENDRDWLLTARIAGEDATHATYLSEPRRLAVKMGEILRTLHEMPHSDCPVQDRMTAYFALVEENYKKGAYDLSFGDFSTADEAYRVAMEGKSMLRNDTLLHGDFCLPNFLFDNWRFSGFIDLGNGGVGDRHIDLFWGAWTLNFNLGTDEYRQDFFDSYGRDKVDEDALRIISAAEIFG